MAYLILHRYRPHLRDELAALFWGDRDDVHARHSLATALWRIRRLIGEDYLLADSSAVQFNPASPIWLDVTEFEKLANRPQGTPEDLAAAIELYRGDLLEGFYDDWNIDERYRLEALYLDVLKRLVTWHEAQDNARAALVYAQKYLVHDPLMEEMHLAAMRALMALGDLSGARRQWQLCCETRQRELHAPPSPEMLEQAERILGAQFTIPLPIEALVMKGPPRGDSLEHPPLVGREHEMDALRIRWKQAAQSQGGIVFISGEAGVGKTRLTEEFAAVVRGHGGIVARGRCYEPERMLPHQPLAEILHDLITQGGHAVQSLPDWARNELARIIPDLLAPPIRYEPSSSSLPTDQQAILFHAIAAAIGQFALRTPLLIVWEDLHWATDSTLAAVHYLARQIANKRVLCLGTFRLEVVGNYPALTTMTAQLAREGVAQHLALERLSLKAIDELVQRTIKAEGGFVNRLYAHTEGNAFFSIETLRSLARTPLPDGPLPLPDNVRALIESRLSHLSRPAREWLACAAVAGRAFDLDLICHASKMEEETALEVIDELLRQGFVCEGSGLLGRDYEFVHHLVQETTYQGIHHRRRERLHRLVGEAMESLYTNQPSLAGVLAHHFEAGSAWEKALHYRDLAAQRASEVFAWREAEEHQSRMLSLLEKVDPDCAQTNCLRRRGQTLATRAELCHLQGRLDERDIDLAALRALIMVSGDEHLRLLEATCQTRYLNLDAKYEQAIITAEKGLILADSQKDSEARCYLLTQIGFAHYFLGQPQSALVALESALTMAMEDNRETRRHITHILGYVHFHLGNYDRSLAYQQESLASHQALRDYNGAAWAGLDIAATYQEMGQLAEAEQYLNEHLELARRIGARSAEAYGLNLSGSWELCRGNYHAAMELFHQALAKQQELRTEHGRVAAETGIGFACYHLGNMNEAQHWLEQAVRRARLIQHRRRMAEALIGLGLAKIAAGQPHTAQGHLTEAVEVARESESRGNLAAGLSALARAERQLGKSALALTHAAEAIQVARNISVITCEMWGELEIGLTLLAQGDPQAASHHSQRALELVARSNERWIGTEQIHRAHARILRVACHDDEAANEQDRLAESIITAKADRIPDPQRRQRYLESARQSS
ncbi:MAG: AAA family ATPase [Anaerolineales bacterium]